MPQWNPGAWYGKQSDDRIRDFVAWERDDDPAQVRDQRGGRVHAHASAWPSSTTTSGSSAGSRTRSGARRRGRSGSTRARRSSTSRAGRSTCGTPATSSCRSIPNGWIDEFRGYAAFLHETEPIYPAARTPRRRPSEGRRSGPGSRRRTSRSAAIACSYPRAWVVHDARGLPRMDGLRRAERAGPMQEMLYADDPIWQTRQPDRVRSPPPGLDRQRPADGPAPLSLRRGPASSETVKVSYPSPQRAELDVKLDTPGHRRPRRRVLSRLEADHRRPARPHHPRQSHDARRGRRRGARTTSSTLSIRLVPHRRHDQPGRAGRLGPPRRLLRIRLAVPAARRATVRAG